MPVIKVWEAKSVIVMKRSMRPGYAGIENPLFFHERTKMLFGDAKDTMNKLIAELKTL
jgi:NAD(P) transhydrogenase subunit beta